MKLRICRLTDTATLPTRGSIDAAGYDLYADETVEIDSGTTTVVPTGLVVEIPSGYFGAVYARSGLATKQGLRPANCTGVIDSDYRGELKVALYNDSAVRRLVCRGDRIAQLVIQPYASVDEWEEVSEVSSLSETERGVGGFGSTGTK